MGASVSAMQGQELNVVTIDDGPAVVTSTGTEIIKNTSQAIEEKPTTLRDLYFKGNRHQRRKGIALMRK